MLKPIALMEKMLPLRTAPPEFSGQLYDVQVESDVVDTRESYDGGKFEAEDNLSIFFGGGHSDKWVSERRKCVKETSLSKKVQGTEEHFFSAAEDGGDDTFDIIGENCMKSSCEETTSTLFAPSSFSTNWPHALSGSNSSDLSNNAQDIAFPRSIFSKKGINCFSDVSIAKKQLYLVNNSVNREAEKPLLNCTEDITQDYTTEDLSEQSSVGSFEDLQEEIVQFRQKIQTTSRKLHQENRRSLQLHLFSDGNSTEQKQHSRHSWYAPTKSYDTLFEDAEQEVKESFLHHNLAAHRQHINSETRDSTALLERVSLLILFYIIWI